MISPKAALPAVSSLVLLALLSACASTPPASGPGAAQTSAAAVPPDDNSSAYGLFLAGTEALNNGDKATAANYFADAAREEPDEPVLRERAFTAALVAGDVRQAAQLAPAQTGDDPSIARLGQLTQAVDAIADGRGHEAQRLLTNPPLGDPFTTVGQLLAPWAAAAAGDWKTALTAPANTGERLTDELNQLSYAMLLERRHRLEDADAAFRKLLADADGSGVYTLAYGAFLERRGRREDAVALYQAALKGDGTNLIMKDALARASGGKPAPAEPTIAEGAADTLLGPTVVLISEKQPELGLAYLRLVLRLDPTQQEAWVLVGDALAASDDNVGAREAYNHVPPGSPEFIDARARLISTYDGQNDAADNATVLQIAQDTVKNAPDDDDALTLLADALRVNDQYAASAQVLDRLIADQGDKAGWQLYYMRGVAEEQADQWPAAEADMKKALSIDPDEPEILNYLGYSWVDRGEHLTEAKAMIEKAVAAKPDSGAIVDSLGWAYYRMGEYAKAVDQLEHATELEPADPDINNHLGDAYWRAGRKTEARFQWELVLTLDPDAKLREEVESKLRTGLLAEAHVAQADSPAAR